jgi:transposase
MAKGYRPVDRDQAFLFPPDMREWLPRDHAVHLVIAAVERMDTSAFHALRKTGGAGAAGYDPDMLLTVLVWAYAHKVTSSRRMEELCRTDVAFRVICARNLPDHCAIARFRKDFPGPAAEFFARVLVLCARLGMGRLGTVALDGMKIAASASKAANRTEKRLRELAEQAVAAHAAADAAEDELYGEGRRGDELPPEVAAWSPRRRGERIAAALAQLEGEREAAEAEREEKAEGFRERQRTGQRTGRGPGGAEVALAEENLARVRAAREAQLARLEERYAAGQPRRGRPAGIDDHCRVRQAAAKVEAAREREAQRQAAAEQAGPGPVRNITDPDSRLMPTRNGFIQGYNTQNVTSEDGLVIATELTDDPVDMAWYEPMTGKAEQAAALIEANRPPAAPGQEQEQGSGTRDRGPGAIGQALADAGYCSEENLTCPGPDRLIATGKRRDLEHVARDGDGDGGSPARDRGGPAVRAMRERLRTEDGIAAYRQRGHIAETPHGHIKHNMGIRQLSVRGKDKAAAEWAFICAVHNLFKALTTGHLTLQALAALAS